MQSLTARFPFKGGWRWSTGHELKSPFSLVIYERTNTIIYVLCLLFSSQFFALFARADTLAHIQHTYTQYVVCYHYTTGNKTQYIVVYT